MPRREDTQPQGTPQPPVKRTSHPLIRKISVKKWRPPTELDSAIDALIPKTLQGSNDAGRPNNKGQ